MSECILVTRGFARAPTTCHVVVARDSRGQKAVLVGELDDNPGTSVTNALELVAESIARELLDGDRSFTLYEYVPKGLPDVKPTFYFIEWKGRRGRFEMPVWHVVDPHSDSWLRHLSGLVMEEGYTADALLAARKLRVVDARDREDLPSAI